MNSSELNKELILPTTSQEGSHYHADESTLEMNTDLDVLKNDYSELLSLGVECFGSEESFNRWLHSYNPWLDMRRMDYVNKNRPKFVVNELRRIMYGDTA